MLGALGSCGREPPVKQVEQREGMTYLKSCSHGCHLPLEVLVCELPLNLIAHNASDLTLKVHNECLKGQGTLALIAKGLVTDGLLFTRKAEANEQVLATGSPQ